MPFGIFSNCCKLRFIGHFAKVLDPAKPLKSLQKQSAMKARGNLSIASGERKCSPPRSSRQGGKIRGRITRAFLRSYVDVMQVCVASPLIYQQSGTGFPEGCTHLSLGII